jgi:hypothetical protein
VAQANVGITARGRRPVARLPALNRDSAGAAVLHNSPIRERPAALYPCNSHRSRQYVQVALIPDWL